MSNETRVEESRSSRWTRLLAEQHYCPDCGGPLSLVRTPEVVEGLGWGTDAFFLCLSDSCPVYVGGERAYSATYGVSGVSTRYVLCPNSATGDYMLVSTSTDYSSERVTSELVAAVEQTESQVGLGCFEAYLKRLIREFVASRRTAGDYLKPTKARWFREFLDYYLAETQEEDIDCEHD